MIQPMLAQKAEHPQSGEEWLAELKLDGNRLLYSTDGGRSAWTRLAQNIKKMALLLSKRGKGWVLWFNCILNFLYLFIPLKYTTPGPFLMKRARGLSSSSCVLLWTGP
jgi:hypothetical protein